VSGSPGNSSENDRGVVDAHGLRAKWIQPASSLLIVVLGTVAVTLMSRFNIIDDAYISFRYARNVARHGELVFNLGERVEGITDLLWTLVLTVPALLGLPVDSAAVWISLACILATSLRLWQLGPVLGATRFGGAVAALLLIFNPNYIGAAANGIEGALFAALLVEMVWRFARAQYWLAAVAASLLFLTRPEGMAPALLLLGGICVKQGSLRKGLRYGIPIAITALGVTAFRLLYFGSFIPNSVIAKSYGLEKLLFVRGYVFAYFRGFFAEAPYLAVILLVSGLWLVRNRQWRETVALVALLCLSTILFSYAVAIRNGGDWMPDYRLLTQYSPVYSVLFIVLLGRRAIPIDVALALLAFPVAQTVLQAVEQRKPFSISIVRATEGNFYAQVSYRLQPVLAEGDIVSAEAIGCISYRLASTRFHDPLGLMDSYIARHGTPVIPYGKSDKEYTVGTIRPSVMVWHWPGHLKGLDQELLDNYVALTPGPFRGWSTCVVMIRRDRFEDLGKAFSDWRRVRFETNSIGPRDSDELE